MIRTRLLAATLVLFGCAGLLAGPAAAQSPHTHQHSFGGADQWAQIFDDPKRDAWQKPHDVIQALAQVRRGLQPECAVEAGDIGERLGLLKDVRRAVLGVVRRAFL